MTSSNPPHGSADSPSLTREGKSRLVADIRALEASETLPEHDPHPGTVGEFAFSWFTQGATQARQDFADVAVHVALDNPAPTLTSFIADGTRTTRGRNQETSRFAPDARLQYAAPMVSGPAHWGAPLGASRASAPPRMPKALLDAVAQARASCPECAEIIHDTFQMALDDGDTMHRSHRDTTTADPRDWGQLAAAAAAPVDWGQPAALMPAFTMRWDARALVDDHAADLPFDHTYRIGASTLTLIPGDLTRSTAEVYVSSDDDTLAMGGGISRALLRASGHQLRAEVDRAKASNSPSVGDVVVTGAPGLRARFVFHAITLRNIRGRRQAVLIDGSVGAVVRMCVHGAFDLVESLNIRSIAFPVVATGAARVPYTDAMHEMADAIVSRLLASRSPVSVEVYLHDSRGRYSDAELVGDFAQHVAQRRELTLADEGDVLRVRSWLEETETETETETAPPRRARSVRAPRVSHPAGNATTALPEPRRLQTLVRALVRLDNRRAELERLHLRATVGKEPSEPGQLATLSRLLSMLRSRRAAIEEKITATPPSSDPRAVFVSSTWSDLSAHRAAVREALGSRGLDFVGMEGILTTSSIPRDATLSHIGRAGTYVVVVGWRYGSVDEATGISFTELEYLHAVGLSKPVVAFLMDEALAGKPVDGDRDGYQRLLAFRDTLTQRHGAVNFSDPSDLAHKVVRALGITPA